MLHSERSDRNSLLSPSIERLRSPIHKFEMGNLRTISGDVGVDEKPLQSQINLNFQNASPEANKTGRDAFMATSNSLKKSHSLSPTKRTRNRSASCLDLPPETTNAPHSSSSSKTSIILNSSANQTLMNSSLFQLRESSTTLMVNAKGTKSRNGISLLSDQQVEQRGSLAVSQSPQTTTPAHSLTNTISKQIGKNSSPSMTNRVEEEHKLTGIMITELELKNLKELSLLHLNLAQQQQSIIAEKDRVIAELRNENNTLKTRLERMDRRLATQPKQTSKRSAITPSPQTDRTSSSQSKQPSTDIVKKKQSKVGKTVNLKRIIKEKKSPKTLKKQTTARRSAGARGVNENLDSSQVNTTKTEQEVNTTALSEVSTVEGETSDSLLRVDNEYYTRQVQEFEELEEETIPNSTHTQSIEVPLFRVHTYSNSYHLEGTEDIDDQTFLKRHQRHENDEKKRKRWDLQRQREKQVIEKLRHNQVNKPATSQKGRNIDTIFPRAEQMAYIEVCEKLPVNIFGHAMKPLTSCEFSLPWYKLPSQTTASGGTPSASTTVSRKRRRSRR